MSDLPALLYREAKMSHKYVAGIRLPQEEEAKSGARKMWVVPMEPIPIAECWDRRNCCIHSEPEWEVTDDDDPATCPTWVLVPVTEPLLTREEAAKDHEVQMKVLWIVRERFREWLKVTDDE